MKLINVPDAADVYTTAIVASCEAHPPPPTPHRFYISQTFQATATQSAVLCYCCPKQPLPKREKYSVSATMHLHNTDRLYVLNAVTACGLWRRADVSKQAASTKSGSALIRHNLLCHVPRHAYRHPNVIRLLKVSFQPFFRRNFHT